MPVYLDHAATTPILPEALAAFTAALGTVGNPSSIHSAGQQAKMLLEDGRAAVAASLDADPVEVVFTSGGTESINLAVKGMFWARQQDRPRPRIVVPGGEHHATVDTVEWLERHEGAVVDVVPLDAQGRVDLVALEARLAAAAGVARGPVRWG
ncbi:aminotransferase class V-fold PLP-dependent enzyme, partial [Curtobacterium sp. CT11-45]|uniref:aminotransferase class V-fold PLP-dependent enzyme n=1 Tax=Curtobacterium sp. CT11-45 TaxID=3243037 RepID=UPI0039AEE894